MKIEVIHLEVVELDEEEREEEMEEVEEDSTMEESSLTKKAHHSQSVIFQKNNVWFLDNGCTNHMTGNKNIFLDTDTTINSQVKMGNGDLVNVKGKAHWRQTEVLGAKFVECGTASRA
ncbi:hypothetical protein AAG906_016515 [Vitis piasezkii]